MTKQSLMQEALRQAKSSGDMFAYFKRGWKAVDMIYLSFLGMAIGTWIYIVRDPSVLALGECTVCSVEGPTSCRSSYV